MSFLSRLFGKAPAPSVPARETPPPKGSAAGAKATEPAHRSGGVDISTLEFGEKLVGLAYDAGAGASQRAAQRRLAELVDANAARIGQLPRGEREDATVLAIAALCQQAGPFDAIAAQIQDPATWLALASTGSSARLRQLAAQRIEAPEHLRTLAKTARESDKAVYRIVKGKLDELHAQEKRADADRAHKAAVGETLERHSYKPFDGAYVATLEHLVGEWQTLAAVMPDEVQARVATAIDRAREVIAQHIRAAGAQAARESAIANAEPVRAGVLLDLRKLLGALLTAPSSDASVTATVAERLTALDERWRMTLQHKSASAAETAQLNALRAAASATASESAASGTLQQQLELIATAAAPDTYAGLARLLAACESVFADETPPLVVQARQLLADHRAQQAAQRASVAEAEHSIAQMLRKAQHALADGRSRQAMGMRRALEPKLASLEHLPKALAERLQQFDAKLNELEDWKRFAVTPKRGELIEQMAALIGSDEQPVQLAERIKQLQEEWKALAKGSTDSDEDWTKFHAAAQTAYEPCRLYFEAQAQQREQNLDRRKALVARLAEYERSTDWEQVEWKNVAQALRAVRQEWRDSGPTERAATKPVEQEFQALIERVEQRLTAEYAANLERKQLLVKQAQRLDTQGDLAQAAMEVKRLQAAWRDVGLTPHREGQQLWEEFKRACDAVFEKRRQESAERSAVHEQAETQAVALCTEAESLAQRSGAELLAGAVRIRELRESFAAIEAPPPHKTQALQRRFMRALEDFDPAVSRQRHLETQRAWETLFVVADSIRVRLLEGGEPTAIAAELDETLTAAKQGVRGAEAALQRKLQASRDVAANAATLRDLVIRTEIVAEASTPERDQTRRRAMQLEALVQRRERPSGSLREQLQALALEFIAIGPVTSPDYEELTERFRQCFQRT